MTPGDPAATVPDDAVCVVMIRVDDGASRPVHGSIAAVYAAAATEAALARAIRLGELMSRHSTCWVWIEAWPPDGFSGSASWGANLRWDPVVWSRRIESGQSAHPVSEVVDGL